MIIADMLHKVFGTKPPPKKADTECASQELRKALEEKREATEESQEALEKTKEVNRALRVTAEALKLATKDRT
jgi:hypothetical protein